MEPRRRAWARGFTLVELLAVVAMIGILAALALVGYRKYLNSAKSSEASAIIAGIRGGEEAYKAETLVYLGCSGCGGVPCAAGAGTLNKYFPQNNTPDNKKWAWANWTHADGACWRMLNVTTDGPVQFGYAVVAGPPGTQPPATDVASPPTWPAAAAIVEPWFVVEAAGDRDMDGVKAYYLATSFQGDIYSENETE